MPDNDVCVQFKGMPMTPQMAPMGFAPGLPGVHPPHGFMPMMPQYPLPFTVPPSGAPPSPMRSGPPGTIQLNISPRACSELGTLCKEYKLVSVAFSPFWYDLHSRI